MNENTGNVVNNTDFKSKGDWINRVIDENCADLVGAQEEIKDDDGKVTQRAKAGKRVVDLDKLRALGEENSLTVKEYPNAGMARMNVGNMLRAAARKRHGLIINGQWTDAADDFEVNDERTENPDGSKIAKAKPEAEAAEA